MKKLIYSLLKAMLLLNLCTNFAYAQDEKLHDHTSLTTPPSYPGGLQTFYTFLGSTIKYPEAAFKGSVQGTTNVSFIIEKNGSLTNIKTEGRNLGYGLEEEAVRAIKLAKPWNPGQLNGKPVRVKYNLPVKFALPNKNKTIYSHVSMETPPTYPGGITQFYETVSKNIVYPKLAADNKVMGTVNVSFIVEADGSLTSIKTVGRKIGSGLEEEAVRVMKLSKHWNPGMQNGKPVRVEYNIPLKFTMKK
ncbi:MAG: energy transducer TonB [Bacteroidia bacterium]